MTAGDFLHSAFCFPEMAFTFSGAMASVPFRVLLLKLSKSESSESDVKLIVIEIASIKGQLFMEAMYMCGIDQVCNTSNYIIASHMAKYLI